MNQPAKSNLPRTLSVAFSFLLGLNVVHAETVRPNGGVPSTVKIGNETKKTIVAYRTAHGAFKSAEALVEVKGIGLKTVEKNAAFIKLGAVAAK